MEKVLQCEGSGRSLLATQWVGHGKCSGREVNARRRCHQYDGLGTTLKEMLRDIFSITHIFVMRSSEHRSRPDPGSGKVSVAMRDPIVTINELFQQPGDLQVFISADHTRTADSLIIECVINDSIIASSIG